jgi:hypothetical protein
VYFDQGDLAEYKHRESVDSSLKEVIEKWINRVGVESSYAYEIYGGIHDLIPKNVIPSPKSKSTDDEKLDRWLSDYIVRRARDGKTNRCVVRKEGIPDNRCTSMVLNHGDICGICNRHKDAIVSVSRKSEAIRKALDALRSS